MEWVIALLGVIVLVSLLVSLALHSWGQECFKRAQLNHTIAEAAGANLTAAEARERQLLEENLGLRNEAERLEGQLEDADARELKFKAELGVQSEKLDQLAAQLRALDARRAALRTLLLHLIDCADEARCELPEEDRA